MSTVKTTQVSVTVTAVIYNALSTM